jgi:hypothetical protein
MFMTYPPVNFCLLVPSLPATNAKRLRKGALATKQSSFCSSGKKAGLLRFARNDG